MQRLGQAGREALLRGKNLGLLCEPDEREEAQRSRRAARDLGARVAHIRPGYRRRFGRRHRETGRMLGRLYDAIECVGLESDVA